VNTCDFLVIGGGVIGLCIARELRRRQPSSRIMLIEKESSCGAHASGRNSGVLHAVSPAFTCSLPFSSYVCDRIDLNLR